MTRNALRVTGGLGFVPLNPIYIISQIVPELDQAFLNEQAARSTSLTEKLVFITEINHTDAAVSC